jgi:hypothetical protein
VAQVALVLGQVAPVLLVLYYILEELADRALSVKNVVVVVVPPDQPVMVAMAVIHTL